MKRSDVIILEDKELFVLNKVYKNVLKPTTDVYKSKSKVYHDPSAISDLDEIFIDKKILEFVADGIKFEHQVVKSKAAFTLPYNPVYIREIYDDKTRVGDDYKIQLKRGFKAKKAPNEKNSSIENKQKANGKNELDLIPVNKNEQDQENLQVSNAQIKFKSKSYFMHKSEEKLAQIESENLRAGSKLTRSLDDLSEYAEEYEMKNGFFITETRELDEESDTRLNEKRKVSFDLNERFGSLSTSTVKTSSRKKSPSKSHFKKLNDIKWDDYVISMLNENTARWLVMKNTSDPKQRKKLLDLVEKKYGKYTRDVRDMELYDDNLSEFEKKKIAEEKEKLKREKEKEENNKLNKASAENNDPNEIPLYRMPHGLKREALKQLLKPDPNFNKTAQNLIIESARVETPKTFNQKMLENKNISEKTLLISENAFQNELVSGNLKVKYLPDENKKKILENGKEFGITLQEVYPADFSAWINGVNVASNIEDGKISKPVKGKIRWKKLPELKEIDQMKKPTNASRSSSTSGYWSLMPTTPDTQLRKIAKSNITFAKIVDEWRKKWQISTRWTQAEIDELIKDLKDSNPNVRFRAVVVCSRAAEQSNLTYAKIEKYKRKLASRSTMYSQEKTEVLNNLVFNTKLYDTVESLIYDANSKLRLSAAITIFIILRHFERPLNEKLQNSKNNVKHLAENVLRDALSKRGEKGDRFTAAQALAIDGFAEREVVEVLLRNYFASDEQVTKEQVTKILSDLSANNAIVPLIIDEYLSSEHARERILALKLFPCLRKPLSQEITHRIIDLMWNDINKSVRKVAAQTLGRTGRGREVHDEIYNRILSRNMSDRIDALNKINFIGIMTDKLLEVYLKCFRDDYISVRELACKSSQNLYETNARVIDALIFMAKFDQVSRLKALAIQTLGLVGEFNAEIRKCLLWALQFELDALIRCEACHSIILLIRNIRDEELMDVLQERHLIEEEPIVKDEIMKALIHLGYNPNRELPIVAKIKSDVRRFTDKNVIVAKIKELDRQLNFEADKQRFIWSEKDENEMVQIQNNSIINIDYKSESDKQSKPSRQMLSQTSASSFLAQLVDNNTSDLSESRSISIDLDSQDRLSTDQN